MQFEPITVDLVQGPLFCVSQVMASLLSKSPLLSSGPASFMVQWQFIHDKHPLQYVVSPIWLLYGLFCCGDISCPFSTLGFRMEKYSPNIDMLPCFPSEPVSCEANHSGWYLAILRSLAVQTVQIPAEPHDSKSRSFAGVVLLFGHTNI